MSNIIYLTSDDFHIQNGNKGKLLCLSDIPGLCFVMYHVDAGNCSYCEDSLPHFKAASRMVPSCTFGLCNLSRNPNIIKLSNATITPFEAVPTFIVYFNGRPLARYEGDRTNVDFAEFVQEMLIRLQEKKQFINNKNFKMATEDEATIPGIGKAYNVVCDEESGKCYLKAAEVYGNNPMGRQKY